MLLKLWPESNQIKPSDAGFLAFFLTSVDIQDNILNKFCLGMYVSKTFFQSVSNKFCTVSYAQVL